MVAAMNVAVSTFIYRISLPSGFLKHHFHLWCNGWYDNIRIGSLKFSDSLYYLLLFVVLLSFILQREVCPTSIYCVLIPSTIYQKDFCFHRLALNEISSWFLLLSLPNSFICAVFGADFFKLVALPFIIFVDRAFSGSYRPHDIWHLISSW